MIQYSSLPEGRYRLILEARNRISGDVLQSASLNVRVISPLLTSRLMVAVVYPLLCVLLVFILLRHYVRYRRHLGESRRIMLEKQKEQELNKMNVSFFTNMSHEFRTPLSLILGPMSEITAELEDTPYNRGLISTVKNYHRANRKSFPCEDFRTDIFLCKFGSFFPRRLSLFAIFTGNLEFLG